MILRTLGCCVAVWVLLAGCGPKPKTEQEVCGPQGCDVCIGLTCDGTSADGGR